jgi:UDP-N-acetylglucosamine/UDP-N-acetylgalactosamine diphosphorylase
MNVPVHIRTAVARTGQEHVLAFWDELGDDARRDFVHQLEAVDWDGLPGLRRLVLDRRPTAPPAAGPVAALLERAATPPCLRLGDTANPVEPAAAVRAGAAALGRGALGAVLVAGGQGTRLGSRGPKGLYRIGPVSRAPLFELLLGKLVAVRRRHGRDVPLAIMTSSATDARTREFLVEHDWCGLDPDRVLVFRQRDLPALDDTSARLLLDGPGSLAVAPDGHGGMLTGLMESGGLEWFSRQGVEHVVSFQVDNPLAMPLDREFLGYHLLADAEFSTQVVTKREPGERVGVVVEVDGRHLVVEYSDLPAALAAERLPTGALRFRAGSIAVHAFAVAFLRRIAQRPDALPLHLAHKAVPFIDAAGVRIEPRAPNAIKFERFIFDVMPLAERVCVVEIEARDGFAPLKNPPGAAADAPEHVTAALLDHARRLLARAGVGVAAGVPVELAAHRILDEDDVAAAVPPGTLIDRPTVVGG